MLLMSSLGAVVPMLPLMAPLSQTPTEVQLSGETASRDKNIEFLIGIPLIFLSVFAAYHTINAIHSPGSTTHKLGLAAGGGILSLVALTWSLKLATSL